ncbi:hypothetical protein O164_23450 [Pseudomonas taiwanensis SJ9]|uniref:Cell division protein FtsH n=1 Tax=Pseudomonas taiwanensis SJ9 TaxID=1388762 RepID=V7D5G7_9PSED|nr:hypothetical protein O164_23450 [Pseudomonas taiwanensis SJ9]
MNKDQPWKLYLLAIGLSVLAAIQFGLFDRAAVQTISYSQFLQLLEQQKVSDLRVEHDRILGKLQEPIAGRSMFSTVRIDPQLSEQLGRTGVTFTGVAEDSNLAAMVGWLMPLIMMLALWFFLFRGVTDKQGLGGLMGVGKSRARVYVERDIKVTFADVAGIDDVKGELTEVVSFLKNQAFYARLGAHVPKGTLLVGPPGTGKTLVAKAIAGPTRLVSSCRSSSVKAHSATARAPRTLQSRCSASLTAVTVGAPRFCGSARPSSCSLPGLAGRAATT